MNRRDIELLISARETTGRTFKQVTDNIADLNRKIDEQVAAAERGEGSLQDLRRTQEQLAAAGRDLSALQGQIDAYRRLEEQQTKNSAASEKAKADYAAMQAELAGLEKVTAAQERKLAGLEKKVRTTSAALDKTTADLQQQTDVLQRAGVATDQLDAAQTQIVNSARQAGAGFVQLGTAVDAFADNVRIARDAEQQLAAQNAFDRKIADARALGDASRFVQLFASAVGQVNAADNQLAALSGFRAIGQQAAEASRDVSRFVTSGQAMAVSSQEIASGLRAIIDPGRAALQTLNGIEAAIETAGAAAVAEKQSVASYNQALNDLSAASAALVQQGALIDTFQQQADKTQLVRTQFEQAQADVQRLGNAMRQADVPTQELARDLQLAETRLAETGRALNTEETRLGELSRALRQAGIDTNDLAAAQARLEAAATKAAGGMDVANKTLGRGGQKPSGLFGLNPYELQNLGYQVNDIIVSLASGQRPLTVLTQQGLQISQLFPGLISSIAKFALAWAPAIIAVGAAAAIIGHYVAEAQRLKQAQQDLATIPTGGDLNAQAYADTTKKLEDMGAKAEDARNAMRALAEEGFDDKELRSYAVTAQQLAERLGIDLVQATELLVGVQQGGIDAVYDLTEKTNLLTTADLDHAEALYEAGRAGEARQFVLDKVAERNKAIAEATQSVWTPAVNNLKSAWNSFTGFLDKTFRPVIDSINSYINDTIVGFTFLTALIAGKGVEGAKADAFGVIAAQRGLNKPVRGESDQGIRDRRFAAELDEEVDNARELTSQERLRKAETEARRRAQNAGVSKALEDRAVQQAIGEEQRKINKEAEAERKRGAAATRRSEAAARKAQRAAEAAQRKIDSTQQALAGQLRQLDSATGRGASATLEQRLAIVDNRYQSIFDTIQKLRGLGINKAADGTDLTAVEAQVNANKERLKQEETIKFYEDQINLLTTQRKDEIENIADAQQRGAKTVAEAYRDAEAVNGRISPQIVQAAQQALAVARNIAGTNPSPEMVSMIARLERIISGEATTPIVNRVGLDALENQEKRLNTLISERNELVEAYQTLNTLGLRSDAETRELVAGAYAAQGQAIRPVLLQMRETLNLLHQQRDALTGLPLISDTAYNAWLAKLQAVEAGLTNTDARIEQVNAAARQGIQQGVTNAFQTAADTIVGLVNGTLSWGDALDNVINAGLSLLGSFLSAIADVLVQMVALQAAKALIGGSTGGLGALFFHGGGVVGSGGQRRSRTGGLGSWAGAPKFHGGGGMGLRPDEYKAVLKRGEEVLTEEDPRHINNLANDNGGGGGGGAPNLKQVLLLDPAEVAGAMQGRAGQRTFMTFIRTNKETIKQVLK